MRPPRHRPRSRVMRLLVFACFFNFSGINNGYTCLTAVSPLNAGQSVSLMGTLVKSFTIVATPQKMLGPFNRGRRFVTALALSSETAAKTSVQRGPHRLRTARGAARLRTSARQSARLKAAPLLPRFTAGAPAPVHQDYLKEKESWREQKEDWSKENSNGLTLFADSTAMGGRQLRLDSFTAVVSPEPVWDEGLRLKTLLRRLSYPDPSARLIAAVFRLHRQIPGSVQNRGLFLPHNLPEERNA